MWMLTLRNRNVSDDLANDLIPKNLWVTFDREPRRIAKHDIFISILNALSHVVSYSLDAQAPAAIAYTDVVHFPNAPAISFIRENNGCRNVHLAAALYLTALAYPSTIEGTGIRFSMHLAGVLIGRGLMSKPSESGHSVSNSTSSDDDLLQQIAHSRSMQSDPSVNLSTGALTTRLSEGEDAQNTFRFNYLEPQGFFTAYPAYQFFAQAMLTLAYFKRETPISRDSVIYPRGTFRGQLEFRTAPPSAAGGPLLVLEAISAIQYMAAYLYRSREFGRCEVSVAREIGPLARFAFVGSVTLNDRAMRPMSLQKNATTLETA